MDSLNVANKMSNFRSISAKIRSFLFLMATCTDDNDRKKIAHMTMIQHTVPKMMDGIGPCK